MIEPKTMEWLVKNGALSADMAVIGPDAPKNIGGAERTRLVVERALEALEANGLIAIVPVVEWPDFYAADPPYINPFGDT